MLLTEMCAPDFKKTELKMSHLERNRGALIHTIKYYSTLKTLFKMKSCKLTLICCSTLAALSFCE